MSTGPFDTAERLGFDQTRAANNTGERAPQIYRKPKKSSAKRAARAAGVQRVERAKDKWQAEQDYKAWEIDFVNDYERLPTAKETDLYRRGEWVPGAGAPILAAEPLPILPSDGRMIDSDPYLGRQAMRAGAKYAAEVRASKLAAELVTNTVTQPSAPLAAVVVQVQEIITEPAPVVEVLEPLTSIQLNALDLYKRGLNVFPVPRPHEVRAWAERVGKDPESKPPYIAQPFYTSRLHLCDRECKRKGCTAPSFESLFTVSNLAAMTGRTSGNMLAVDCDSQKAFVTIGQELESRGLPFWAYRTHKGGAFLLRLAEGEAANMPSGKTPFENVEIWGNRHYVVLPPSVHPSGEVYQWVTTEPRDLFPLETIPTVTLQSLEWLGVHLARNNWKEPELYGLPAWASHLSKANRKILATAKDLRDGGRNQALIKPLYDIAAHIRKGNIDYYDAEAVIFDAAAACGYPESDLQAMFKSALHKRGVTPARDWAKDHAQTWQRAAAFGASYDWRVYGRSAQGARAAFMACVERAKAEGDSFRASERELAELANFREHKRARRTLRLLSSDTEKAPALLRKLGKTTPTGANLYRFTDVVFRGIDSDPSNTTCSFSGVIIDTPKRDTFLGLGVVAYRTWAHLLTNPEHSINAIAKATKQVYSSVRLAVRRLQAHGLVTFGTAEHMYYAEAKTNGELQRLAETLGTCGKAEELERKHNREREKRANRLLAGARRKWQAGNRAQEVPAMGDTGQDAQQDTQKAPEMLENVGIYSSPDPQESDAPMPITDYFTPADYEEATPETIKQNYALFCAPPTPADLTALDELVNIYTSARVLEVMLEALSSEPHPDVRTLAAILGAGRSVENVSKC